MLTAKERKAAADCAEKYPAECGGSYFSDRVENSTPLALDRMLNDPKSVKNG